MASATLTTDDCRWRLPAAAAAAGTGEPPGAAAVTASLPSLTDRPALCRDSCCCSVKVITSSSAARARSTSIPRALSTSSRHWRGQSHRPVVAGAAGRGAERFDFHCSGHSHYGGLFNAVERVRVESFATVILKHRCT